MDSARRVFGLHLHQPREVADLSLTERAVDPTGGVKEHSEQRLCQMTRERETTSRVGGGRPDPQWAGPSLGIAW